MLPYAMSSFSLVRANNHDDVDSAAGIKRPRNVPIEFCTGHMQLIGINTQLIGTSGVTPASRPFWDSPMSRSKGGKRLAGNPRLGRWSDHKHRKSSQRIGCYSPMTVRNSLERLILAAEKQLGDFFIIWASNWISTSRVIIGEVALTINLQGMFDAEYQNFYDSLTIDPKDMFHGGARSNASQNFKGF